MSMALKSKQSTIPNRKQWGKEEEDWRWSERVSYLIRVFCVLSRDEDEDGLRDTETDTTSKSKDDVAPFGQRMTDASSSNQAAVMGELLNSVVEEEGSATNNARNNENQSRNGTVSEPGQGTGNDVDEAFLNPMDIL